MEDYIEAIYNIINEKKIARSKDIKRLLKVQGASVTGALRTLSEKGLIHYEPYEVITLTSRGEQVAKMIAKRHEVIKDFLVKILSITPNEAEEVACGMEHSLTPTVTFRLAAFLQLFEKNPDLKKLLQSTFIDFLADYENRELDFCVMKDKISKIA